MTAYTADKQSDDKWKPSDPVWPTEDEMALMEGTEEYNGVPVRWYHWLWLIPCYLILISIALALLVIFIPIAIIIGIIGGFVYAVDKL